MAILPRLSGAWLASHLLMVQILRRAYPPDHFLNIAIDQAHSDPGLSHFAYKISLVVADFAELFVQANRRGNNPLLDSDGFVIYPLMGWLK